MVVRFSSTYFYYLVIKYINYFLGSIDITILSPLETKGLVREDVTKLMENTYSVMTDYLESISPSPNNNIAKSKFD